MSRTAPYFMAILFYSVRDNPAASAICSTSLMVLFEKGATLLHCLNNKCSIYNVFIAIYTCMLNVLEDMEIEEVLDLLNKKTRNKFLKGDVCRGQLSQN